jgi:hypothetical protein
MYADYRQTMDIRGWRDRNNVGAGKATYHADGTVTWENGASCEAYEGNPLLGDNQFLQLPCLNLHLRSGSNQHYFCRLI